jgi:hypothetical protein
MSMYRVLNAVTALVVVIASLFILSGHADAHERRTIGPYEIEVGWLNEPAYLGQLNSIALHVTDTRNSRPATGLEKTLTADVAAGGLSPYTLTLSAQFDTPGSYEGWIMPTVAGSYTFHLKGKIDTLNVDEKFTSGPNTFGDVEDIAAVQYPAKVPVADGLSKKLDAIQSGIDQTRIIAIAALALAVIGLGGVALARRRS